MSLVETPGYFRATDGTPLYGFYHPPRATDSQSRLPILIAPPLFEERKSSYATLTALARFLALAGHPVLRFDYRGSGESSGEPGARRWSDLASDLSAAAKALAHLAGKEAVALLGLRLGATLGILEADRVSARFLIALAPVVSGAAQARAWRMRSKIRAELSGSGKDASPEAPATPAQAETSSQVLDLDGFPIAKAFLADVEGADLLQNAAPLACSSLLVQISHRTEASAESEALAKKLGPRHTLTALRMEPFWERLEDVDFQPLQPLILEALHDIA